MLSLRFGIVGTRFTVHQLRVDVGFIACWESMSKPNTQFLASADCLYPVLLGQYEPREADGPGSVWQVRSTTARHQRTLADSLAVCECRS